MRMSPLGSKYLDILSPVVVLCGEVLGSAESVEKHLTEGGLGEFLSLARFPVSFCYLCLLEDVIS